MAVCAWGHSRDASFLAPNMQTRSMGIFLLWPTWERGRLRLKEDLQNSSEPSEVHLDMLSSENVRVTMCGYKDEADPYLPVFPAVER